MPPTELDTLLHTLRDRNIDLGEDDVVWAFEDETAKDRASAWINEYLQPATLLTKDELAFTQKHNGRGLHAQPNTGRPISDAEYEAALMALEASTAAIDRQCEILESQKRALQEIRARNATVGSTISIQDKRQKRTARQRAQLDFDVEELGQGLQSNVRSSLKQGEVATAGLPSSVERLLEKDDRLLDGLQKLLPKLTDSSQEEDEATDVEFLCSTLASLSVDEIHARLDKAYRDCIVDHGHLQNGSDAQELSAQQLKQRKNLRVELAELSGEIDGLVSIVVDHQYRKPLKDGVLASRDSAQAQKSKWCEYTISALSYLTARLDALADHVEQVHTQSTALRAVSGALEETVAVRDGKGGAFQSGCSPLTSTPTAKGLKPLRLVQANFSESQDPAVPFLRYHEIRVQDGGNEDKLVNALHSAVRDQRQRLDHLSRSTEDTLSTNTAKSLLQPDANVQSLAGAVYAHSPYGTKHLVGSTSQALLDNLERKTQTLGDEMREVDVEAIADVVKAKQRDAVHQLVDN